MDQHSDFIQKRFDDLDSQGFIWSKQSILDIFLQLGLSDSRRDSFSSGKYLSESRVCQETGISFDGVKEVLREVELQHNSRPVGLVDLPIEVFQKILEQLDCIATLERVKTYRKKHLAKVLITGPGDRKPYTTYLHRNLPVLNSIQNFSLTSREIYTRCEPWLWKGLSFPTDLPAPIDLWTKDILLKRGSHVRSLKLCLSENCSKPPGDSVYDPFYDNLIINSDLGCKWISPNNAKDLIHLCPNLSHLRFYYCQEEKDEEKDETEGFLLDLIPLLSNLKLRHLAIESSTAIFTELRSKVVDSLPLLESLTVRRYSSSGTQEIIGDASFGYNLSKLEYLSRLNIGFNEDINEKWCLYDWPGTLTDLTLVNHGDLLPSSAIKIIQHISPYLTKLTLSFGDMGEIDPGWSPQSCLSLPSLTYLDLCSGNAHLLASFQKCKSLCYLEWTYWTLEFCSSLNSLLFEGNWPHLKKLRLRGCPGPDLDDHHEEVEEQLLLLEDHCEQGNINVIIHRYYDDPFEHDEEFGFFLPETESMSD